MKLSNRVIGVSIGTTRGVWWSDAQGELHFTEFPPQAELTPSGIKQQVEVLSDEECCQAALLVQKGHANVA